MNIEVPASPWQMILSPLPKRIRFDAERELFQLISVQRREERLGSEQFQIDFAPAGELSAPDQFNLLRGKRKPDPSPIELVPYIRPDTVDDIGKDSAIHQPEFDFVLYGRFGEVDQEDFYRWIAKHSRCDRGGLVHRIFDLVWRNPMIHADTDACRVSARWIVKIDDCRLGQLAVRNIEADIVIVAETSRSPIEFDHFNVLAIDDQPVTDSVSSSGLKSKTRKNISKRVLQRKTDNYRHHARSSQEAGNGNVIKSRQAGKRRKDEYHDCDYLREKGGNSRILAGITVERPDKPAQQRVDWKCRCDHCQKANLGRTGELDVQEARCQSNRCAGNENVRCPA